MFRLDALLSVSIPCAALWLALLPTQAAATPSEAGNGVPPPAGLSAIARAPLPSAAPGSRTAPDTGIMRVSSAPERSLVIFLHGIRGSGRMMAQIGQAWGVALPETRFVAPNAPFPHRSQGYQWFAVDDQLLRPDRIQAARGAFDALIDRIIEKEGFEHARDRVALVGVSQGAIMGLDAVATGRLKVGALVTFAGLLPFPPTDGTETGTAIFLMHGDADQTIPAAASKPAADQLRSSGFTVTSKIFRGVGHTVSTEEAREALAFLKQHFDERSPPAIPGSPASPGAR
jgi:phospholipase/carboxylesterase